MPQKKYIKKPIILIMGVAGTGKTTLSRILTNELNIDHRIGLGWIREALRAYLYPKKYPNLFTYSFRPKNNSDLYKNFYKQALTMKPAIEACLKRAKEEGTSLVVEGVNLIPGLINRRLYDFYFFLKASDNAKKHKEMLESETHYKRKMLKGDLEKARRIEKELLEKCKKINACIISYGNNKKRKEKILKVIKSGRY